LLVLGACRSSRVEKSKVNCKLKEISLAELNDSLKANMLYYDWMAVRAKMDYDDGFDKQSFTANIRMRTDSVLWVLFSGTLSYEGARALMTPDSMWVTNRLDKVYHEEPFDKINVFLPFRLKLKQLQEVVIGNPINLDTLDATVKRKDCMYLIQGEDDNYAWTYSINPENYTVTQLRLKDKLRYRELIASFDNYEMTDRGLIAMSRKFEVTVSGNTVHVGAELSRLKLDEPLGFPFKVNPNYEKVKLE
jgi:hypothetical protein